MYRNKIRLKMNWKMEGDIEGRREVRVDDNGERHLTLVYILRAVVGKRMAFLVNRGQRRMLLETWALNRHENKKE